MRQYLSLLTPQQLSLHEQAFSVQTIAYDSSNFKAGVIQCCVCYGLDGRTDWMAVGTACTAPIGLQAHLSPNVARTGSLSRLSAS
jgi:hypothetical protein